MHPEACVLMHERCMLSLQHAFRCCRIRTELYDTLKYIVNYNNQKIGSLVGNLAC